MEPILIFAAGLVVYFTYISMVDSYYNKKSCRIEANRQRRVHPRNHFR